MMENINEVGPDVEIPDGQCFCEYVTFKPCTSCAMNIVVTLDKNETIILRAYRMSLHLNKKPTPAMMRMVNNIYDKYPDFYLGCETSEL